MMQDSATWTGVDIIQLIRNPERLTGLSLRQWDLLLRVCRRANLLGRLAEGVQATGIEDRLPAAIHPHLLSARVLTSHQRQAIVWEAGHIAKALSALDTPVVLLKGAAYVLRDLAAAKGRLFGDVDILVPRSALNAVEGALMVRGWAGGQHDAYDERYYREWMHEIPPMSHRGRGTVIDVHHNILPLTARHCPDANLLLQARQPVQGTIFSTFCNVDIVIHSATHLFHESELQNGLRDLFDLEALILEFSADSDSFWDELVDRALALGLSLPVLLALRHTNAILGTSVPEHVIPGLLAKAKLNRWWIQTLDAIYLRALMPDHRTISQWPQSLARASVYLRGHALRMPPSQLVFHLGRKLLLRLFRNTSRSE